MKKYAVLHEPGDIVTLAGTRFVVLDVERRGSLPDSLFLLALESVGASEFGGSNNYAESDLKKAVDKWLEDMSKRGLDNAKLIPREIDLTTLDGSRLLWGRKKLRAVSKIRIRSKPCFVCPNDHNIARPRFLSIY